MSFPLFPTDHAPHDDPAPLHLAPAPAPAHPRTPASYVDAPAVTPLPDPALFPPFRRPTHHQSSLPALSSPGSSSASTRSSAHTSSGSALAFADFSAHVHDPDDDDPTLATGITSQSLARILAHDPAVDPAAHSSRWSGSHEAHVRDRIPANSATHDLSPPMPPLRHKQSYDTTWHPVEDRDDLGVSEDETDDDHPLHDDAPHLLDENDEERTSAAVIADEGRGLIVQADSTPIVHLEVQPGTTHLLMGSSVTPNSVPTFLTKTLPHICTTLLALDISANFLGALPPVLGVCETLEELNVASNPLRVLPVFLADLTNLRVLIADATGISTLPDALVDLDKLHTISVKRNKMHSLPSWLCLLPALQTLCVDGNPFQGPWKALVDPLLSKAPSSPAYPPSTPIFPSQVPDSSHDTETDTTDLDDLSDHDLASPNQNEFIQPPEDEDHTITPDRGPILGRSVTSPYPASQNPPPLPQPRGALTRTRTTPSRAYFDQTRAKNAAPTVNPKATRVSKQEDPGYFGDHELRKMKSAGDLRRGKSAAPVLPTPTNTMPPRPPLSQYQTSLSSSNLLNMATTTEEETVKRFASLGPASLGAPARTPSMARPQLTQSMWANSPEAERDPSSVTNNRMSFNRTTSTPSTSQKRTPDSNEGKWRRNPREGKEKTGRWGFLKKMSMGKMKVDSPSPPHPSQMRSPPVSRPTTASGASPSSSPIPDRFSKAPQVDLRFSTVSSLEPFSIVAPSSSPTPPSITRQPSRDLLQPVTIPPRSASLLAPPVSPRPSKRRSFLPVDAPGALSLTIPIPEASAFPPDAVAISGDEADVRVTAPSPAIDSEQYIRREEERAREAYMRALRSVMAYLKDMNDLSLSQQVNPLSMYGAVADENPTLRPRRPTVVDNNREVSVAMSDSSGQLRSSDSISGMRSGSSSNTMSVATTDSNGSSSEERKFKDDKGKRAMVVREIVLTERTYVKGLQELVDIYIKPGSVPVNLLSGVGSGKDSVVPASERKIVFGGIDALFSFHKDSFLPALEVAAAPIMKTSAELREIDADGQLSSKVAKAVGEIFIKHAAFMKMYSGYINNFDNAVQRVKYWSSNKNTPPAAVPPATISPVSSTTQLAGLGLSMSAISAPGVVPEGSPSATGIPNLSTGQKRRIKSYLKRCRMNPRHTQLNLEGYLLLPVQRVPRYRLLLEELLRSTPPQYEFMEDPLDRALDKISSLANNMNEGKRESESRRKLVQWQARIRGRFPSPLVQPHRRLIMDGPLLLTRVVRKTVVSFEAINAQGDASTVQVDCLAPELTPRPLIGILCNDLLVLCRDPSEGQDPASFVDLWAVLRMQTLPQPASIVHGNALRLVDNKAILYFDAPSPSDALNWYRAINLHIPASKT